MKYSLLFLAIIPFLRGGEVTSAEQLGNACSAYGYNLYPLQDNSYDYETQVFEYGGSYWVIVYNFCRNTIRTCSWVHFAAFMNAPDSGYRCWPTLTSGDWFDADYGIETYNGSKLAE